MAEGDRVVGSVEEEVFLQELHDALVHLRDLPVRHAHPLCRRLGQTPPISPTALQRLLLDAVEQLCPPRRIASDAPRSRRYRYLKLRYVEGALLDEVVTELGISDRQARREHRAALQELGALLVGPRMAFTDVASVRNPPETVPFPEDDLVDLESELSPLEASSEVEVIRLGAAVEDAIGLVAPLAANRGVVVEFEPPETGPKIIANPTVLRQILLSVLSSLIAAHSPKSLRVELAERDARAEVHVVPSEARDLDQPRGDAARSLQAACRLADGQDAVLWTENLATEATSVHLRFRSDAATLVLVVDDNPGLVRLFRRYLQEADVRLIPARNGLRAQNLTRALRPKVIILDLMMPVQDGWDLFRSLRAEPVTAAIPVIACSVLPERELALSLGVDHFLAKPVTPENLLAVLTRYGRSTPRV